MRFLIVFLSVILASIVVAQNSGRVWLDDADSAEIIVYHYVSKEMITPDGVELFNELGKAKLSFKQLKKFHKSFEPYKKYGKRSALLTHFNVEIILYEGSFTEFFQISSITRTIYHYHEGNEKLDFGFVAQIGRKQQRFILKVLKSYKLLMLIDEDIRFK